MSKSWFEVDKAGLRQTLARKSKTFAIAELLQNAFDEEGCTSVDVILTKPDSNGMSTLTVTDNSPKGYKDMSTAHTLFASSYKKSDPSKRGRFNLGEKLVLSLCDEATITSTSGQTIFHKNGTRTERKTKTTSVGSEFRGVLPMEQSEWDIVAKEIELVIAPIKTTYNGKRLKPRKPYHTFSTTLPTEVSDDQGIMRRRDRKTEVKLYVVDEGEAYLYEKGLPVCPIDCKWSVEVYQKIPVNLERDSVSDAYKMHLYVAVINECHDSMSKEDVAAIWVQRALEDEKISAEAASKVLKTQYGDDAVLEDLQDKGSNSEAQSHGRTLIPRGALNRKQLRNLKGKTDIKVAGAVFPTDFAARWDKVVPAAQYSADLARFLKLVEDVAPHLLNHKLAQVRAIDDASQEIKGCTVWGKKEFVFTVNLAHHNIHDWSDNLDLLIHEFAHFREQSNAHLLESFWRAEATFGAKLAQLALSKPKLFKGIEVNFAPENMAEAESQAVAA